MADLIGNHPSLFRRLRMMLFRHNVEVHWSTAKARLATIIACSLIIVAVVFAAAFEGFWLLQRQKLASTGQIVGLLLDFLFLTLGLMLVFSGGLILYGSLFNSNETAFLLASPVRDDRVFAYKFQGAVGFSSWAFVLLGLPVLAAYGIVNHVHWVFWPALPLFLAGFLLSPGSIGALGCLAIVNLAPNRRKQVFIAALMIIGALIVFWAYRLYRSVTGHTVIADRDALNQVLGQLTFASQAWVPSHWLTRGLQAAVRGDVMEAAFPLALVWSNGLMLYLVASAAAVRWYRTGYNRMASGGSLRKRYGGAWLDTSADRLLWFLDHQTRLLFIKDFRSFRRDPRQWAQVLIFVGLALAYFGNSRQLYRNDLGRTFQHGVAFVNITAICMLLCAYMGRFIYPMLSLEGRKFWILGLMPLKRRRLLLGKFAFAAVGSLLIAVPLVITNDWLLELPAAAVALHGVVIVAASAGLSGLAVGIGALLPNFRETDPSKIAVGFGGTMNLLAGLMFLLVEICLIAGPFHITAALNPDRPAEVHWSIWQVTGISLGVIIAIATTIGPLRAGVRALERMEF